MPYKEFEISDIGKVTIYKRKGTRSLRLTVAPDGSVRVTMPTWAPYQAGVAFIASRRAWIQAQHSRSATLLVHGQQIGKVHRLVFQPDPLVDTVRTSVRRAEVVVSHSPRTVTSDEVVQAAAQAACWRALKVQSKQLLGQRLEQLALAHNFSYKSLHIKRMKSRWGSCDQHGNIVLNLFLVQLPWEFIDYVILHELVHTKALNHGPDFWQLLEIHLPGARAKRRKMKIYRPTLLVADREAMA